MSIYTPSQKILDKYAEVLVNFALNSGKGVKSGQVVHLVVNESAKPLYIALSNQILRSGAIPLTDYRPDHVTRQHYELASLTQLKYFPGKYYRGLIDQIDHSIFILSETDLHELEGINPQKIMARSLAYKPAKDWRDAKEYAGKFTWTIGLYGTPAMAKEARLTQKAYWDQIVTACFLNDPDPIAKWRQVTAESDRIRRRLNSLPMTKVHVLGDGVNLTVALGPHRRWLGGSGNNIPSFEIFTSPDWRGTEGHIEFNQPLYRYGSLVSGIKLDFKSGRVIKSSATKNYSLLKAMLASPNADKLGEFSLTDKRLSPITRFMAHTLFDENISGPWGNTHIALGSSYHDSYTGNPAKITKARWAAMGFNDSAIHTDIISTTRRTVTAFLADGTQKVIYHDGQFTL